MNNFSKIVAVLVASTFFYGCLDFVGEDINIVAPNVTSKELEIVSQRTGIIFPEGTTGLGYFFQGSGIDDAIALKTMIPENKKQSFLENEIFKSGENSKPSFQIGRSKSWWKLDELFERIDRTKKLPKGRYMECSIGREDSMWIVYISWMET
jgi:hypothetical protein